MKIDRQNGFYVYETTSEDITLMKFLYEKDFHKRARYNSYTVYEGKEHREAGIIGEIAFQHYAGPRGVVPEGVHYGYDIIFCGDRVDVKTKLRNVIPVRKFEASNFSYQNDEEHKLTKYYAFLSTIPKYRYVWFCGWTTRDGFWKHPNGKFWKKGEVDSTNHKPFDADTWSVFYKDIHIFTDSGYA